MDVLYATARAGRWIRYGLRSARDEVAGLVRSAGRVREPGPEREQLIQSIKSAGAALLAWIVAAYLLRSPVALMAPWVALVLVQATVYRSVLKGVKQVLAIAIGGVLALAVALMVGNTLIALAISLPVMLLLGQWRHFGAEGIYAATTALFVLAYGPLSWGGVLDRLAEAALGAAIGIAVNAFIHPPVLLRSSRTWVQSLSSDLHELLTDIADGLAGDFGYDDARGWHARVDGLDRSLEDLRSTLSRGRESVTLNPVRNRHEPTEPERNAQSVAATFERLVDHVADVTRTLIDDGDMAGGVVGRDDDSARARTLLPYGAFLREVAGGVLTYAGRVTAQIPQTDATARLDEQARCAEAAFDRFREHLRTASGHRRDAVLGALMLAGHRLIVDLGAMRRSAAGEQVAR